MPVSRRRLVQFRIRTLLVAVTLFCAAGGGFLWWWRLPFTFQRVTSASRWDHLALLQASAPPSGKISFRERARVYRELSGNYINDGPLQVFDSRGIRLRLEPREAARSVDRLGSRRERAGSRRILAGREAR